MNRSARRGDTGMVRAGLTAALVAMVISGSCLLTGCGDGAAAATPRTIEFLVEGMHCDSCEEAIVHSVSDINGVTACRVDHESGTASIDVDGRDPHAEALLAEAIAKLGFVVRTPGSAPPATDQSNWSTP